MAASAGNHAQAVAYHARRLGIGATIVMPERAPLMKVLATRRHGAHVLLRGEGFDEALSLAREIERDEGRTFIHAFDDDHVIAGQGTVGLELLEQIGRPDVVVVPVGGGGLISGIACGLKESFPDVRVVGVEAEVYPSARLSLLSGRVVEAPFASSIADGIAIKRPGKTTFAMMKTYVDEIVTVSEAEIASAVLLLLEREKTVVEGAGAVGLSALLARKVRGAEGRRCVCVLSGGNIDVNLLSRIIERGLVRDGRLVRLQVSVPDRPGMLATFITAIAQLGANVVEIHHSREFAKVALSEVEIQVTVETRGASHVEELLAGLRTGTFRVRVVD